MLSHFDNTETLVAIGHELGHIKGQKRFKCEIFLALLGTAGFGLVTISLRLWISPIVTLILLFVVMFLMLNLVLWHDEYRADLEGARVTSPEALIATLEGLQENQKNMGKNDYGSETHPPLHVRIELLMRLLD